MVDVRIAHEYIILLSVDIVFGVALYVAFRHDE